MPDLPNTVPTCPGADVGPAVVDDAGSKAAPPKPPTDPYAEGGKTYDDLKRKTGAGGSPSYAELLVLRDDQTPQFFFGGNVSVTAGAPGVGAAVGGAGESGFTFGLNRDVPVRAYSQGAVSGGVQFGGSLLSPGLGLTVGYAESLNAMRGSSDSVVYGLGVFSVTLTPGDNGLAGISATINLKGSGVGVQQQRSDGILSVRLR